MWFESSNFEENGELKWREAEKIFYTNKWINKRIIIKFNCFFSSSASKNIFFFTARVVDSSRSNCSRFMRKGGEVHLKNERSGNQSAWQSSSMNLPRTSQPLLLCPDVVRILRETNQKEFCLNEWPSRPWSTLWPFNPSQASISTFLLKMKPVPLVKKTSLFFLTHSARLPQWKLQNKAML